LSTKKQDPELFDDDTEGVGGEEHYDQKAVETVEYDHAQFELPDDFEVGEDEDD
jgi:hypothetical protein